MVSVLTYYYMKNLKSISGRVIFICVTLLFVFSYHGYTQVVTSARSGSMPSLQVPEDAISLTFGRDKERSSCLKIKALEFKNGKEVLEGRRSENIDVDVDLNPGSVFYWTFMRQTMV